MTWHRFGTPRSGKAGIAAHCTQTNMIDLISESNAPFSLRERPKRNRACALQRLRQSHLTVNLNRQTKRKVNRVGTELQRMKTLFHDNGVYLCFNDLRVALWSACGLTPLWYATEWRGWLDSGINSNQKGKTNSGINSNQKENTKCAAKPPLSLREIPKRNRACAPQRLRLSHLTVNLNRQTKRKEK